MQVLWGQSLHTVTYTVRKHGVKHVNLMTSGSIGRVSTQRGGNQSSNLTDFVIPGCRDLLGRLALTGARSRLTTRRSCVLSGRSGKTPHQIRGDQLATPVPAKSRSVVQTSASTQRARADRLIPAATASLNAISLSANTGVNAATGTTVIIASNSGRLKPSSMRRRASWTTRSVVTSAADRPASNSAPELLPRAAATRTAASTTSVDAVARMPWARSAIRARTALYIQSM